MLVLLCYLIVRYCLINDRTFCPQSFLSCRSSLRTVGYGHSDKLGREVHAAPCCIKGHAAVLSLLDMEWRAEIIPHVLAGDALYAPWRKLCHDSFRNISVRAVRLEYTLYTLCKSSEINRLGVS